MTSSTGDAVEPARNAAFFSRAHFQNHWFWFCAWQVGRAAWRWDGAACFGCAEDSLKARLDAAD